MSISLMAQAWKVEGINQTEKIVMLALCDCANDDGMCFPSITTLQKKCCLSDRGVQKAMSSLEVRGFLSREVRQGKSTVYWLTPERGSPPNVVHPERRSPTPERRSPPPPNVVHPTPEPRSPINITETSIEPSLNHHTICAREEDKRPVTSNPGGEGPHNGEQAKPVRNAKKRKHTVDEWTGPSDRTWELIAKAGIERGFAESLLDEFRLYWEEQGERRPGWEATFLGHVKRSWERKTATQAAPARPKRGNHDTHSDPIADQRARKARRDNWADDWAFGGGSFESGQDDLQGDVIDLRAQVC